MRYQNLLSPIMVGGQIIKNRLTYPNASPHFLQGPETYPAEGYRAFAANLAKNGAAIVNFAEWAEYPQQRHGPMDMDMTHMQAFDMTDPAVHNYVSQMCEEVHFYGSKIILTTNMVYPDGFSLYGGRGMGPMGKPTEKLPTERMHEVIELTLAKVRRYKNLGYDGVSFRADMLMSPGGQRDDQYDGGTVENRTRLFHEVCSAMRKAFGKKFIIEAVLAWEQNNGYGGNAKMGGGYNEDDAMEFIRLFDDVVDILEVREHDGCASHPTGYNFTQGVHPAVDFCAKVKKMGFHMLMKPIGGFQEPDEMERYLIEGKCDMFGIARGFMADDEYGKKLYEGRGEDITPCLKCNKCHGVMLPEPDPWTSVCSVNPLMGLGHKIHRLVEKTAEPKKVAVIGGGPAGMRAAIYAAQRGHDVTLYEKTDRLGGQLFHGDYFPFKWPIKNFKNWLIYELGKSGAKVVMNTEPTRQMIVAGGYDVVLAATGAKVNIPNIPGLKDENGKLKPEYMSCLDTCGREPELGKHVVIVGGSEVGIETAMYLCGKGHDVTVLTRQKKLAHNASGLHYITMAFVKAGPNGEAREASAWEAYDNLTGITEAETVKVEGNTVTYRMADGEHTVTGDSVVICGGMTPLTAEAFGYSGLTTEFYAIGDCNGAGNLEVCNREAYSRAMIL
mgnify:FL=1